MTRLLEPTIKAAILHPEEEVRVTAVSYFSGSFSPDESMMALVIQAVETYGRDKAFRILRAAESLAQTHDTVAWLIRELRRDYDLADLDEDNYRFAIALILYHARPEVLLQRKGFIIAIPMFPDQLRGPLDERLDMLCWDWDRGWTALEVLGQVTMRRGRFTWNDVRFAHHIVGSLARHRSVRAASILDVLESLDRDRADALWRGLEPLVVSLAGVMRLESAIPLLVDRLSADSLSVNDAAITALIRINTDAVVHTVADKWRDADAGFRSGACDVLEHIHTDICAERCLAFFAAEENPDTRLFLAHALLSQFIEDDVELVRQLVLGHHEKLTPDGLDIRYRLVVACSIMGTSFPEYEKWHEDALANNWGLGDYRPPRLADSFRLAQPGPARSRNGKRLPWIG